MKRFAELAHSTLGTEMDLHRAYAAEWGISGGRSNKSALTRDPRLHGLSAPHRRPGRLRRARGRSAALHVGLQRAGSAAGPSQPPTAGRYRRWIDMYAGEEFANQARWCREVCDEAAAGTTEEARSRMQDAFLASSQYELDFWEQAWRSVS